MSPALEWCREGSLGLLASLPVREIANSWVSERPYLKGIRNQMVEKTPDILLWPTHTHITHMT